MINIKRWFGRLFLKPSKKDQMGFTIGPIISLSPEIIKEISQGTETHWRAVSIYFDYFDNFIQVFLANGESIRVPIYIFNFLNDADPNDLCILEDGKSIGFGLYNQIPIKNILWILEGDKNDSYC